MYYPGGLKNCGTTIGWIGDAQIVSLSPGDTADAVCL